MNDNYTKDYERIGDEETRLMHLVPAPAVRLMKRRVLSRPGVNSLMSFHERLAWRTGWWKDQPTDRFRTFQIVSTVASHRYRPAGRKEIGPLVRNCRWTIRVLFLDLYLTSQHWKRIHEPFLGVNLLRREGNSQIGDRMLAVMCWIASVFYNPCFLFHTLHS